VGQQLNAIASAHDRAAFDQVMTLKETAEGVAAEARKQLVAVAAALASAWVDNLDLEGTDVNTLSLKEIAQGTVAAVRRRIGELEWRARPPADTKHDAAELARLRGEVAQLSRANENLQTRLAAMTAQVAAASKPVVIEAPVVVDAPPAPALPSASTPAPVTGAPSLPAAAGLEAPAAALLRLMVETGEGRVPALREQLAGALDLGSDRAPSVYGGFEALQAAGLIEDVETGLRGNPHLAWPAEAAADTYQALAGKRPSLLVVPELLKRHRSPDHTYLNLETAGLFEQLGCTVNRLPAEVRDEANGRFVPDLLVVTPEGEPVFVEVEMGKSKQGKHERVRKWAVIAGHTGGVFRVVCATVEALRKINNELSLLAVDHVGHLDAGIATFDEMAKQVQKDPGISWDDLWTRRWGEGAET
jgi:hypothetical protein